MQVNSAHGRRVITRATRQWDSVRIIVLGAELEPRHFEWRGEDFIRACHAFVVKRRPVFEGNRRRTGHGRGEVMSL